MLINDDFLGRGWRFPIAPGLDGRLQWSSGIDDIHQSIDIILGTTPGERVMVPTFGCQLRELVFDLADGTTLGRAQRYVEEALAKWEPRIKVQDVVPGIPPGSPNVMLVSIDYVVQTTNRSDNHVYPFYFL